VLATDALITSGGNLAEISEETMVALNEFLPPHWSHNNPIDILGDADAERYQQVLEIAANDPNSDGLLVILTPQAMTAPTQTAQLLKKMYGRSESGVQNKPVLASWMGGADVAGGEAILNQSNIPTFPYPDSAARVFHYMWRYNKRLNSLYETPQTPEETADQTDRHTEAKGMIDQIRQSGRTILTEYESKQILEAYGITTVETRLATGADEAVAIAEEIGYPVVLKLNSETITHKTDVGGVRLDLIHAKEVRRAYKSMQKAVTEKFGETDEAGRAHFLGVTVQPMVDLGDGYELIIGSSPDPQFGPVLLFGTGGTLVEVFKDRYLGLPPLNTTLARRMMERTKIYKALQGIRGRDPVNLEELEKLLVRFSYLVVEQRWIKEIDINPLLASPNELLALDARVVLYGQDVTEEMLPRLAIRPYPSQYISTFTDRTGETFMVRPIRPEDEPKIVEFHHGLSEQSIYLRYFRSFQLDQRVEHERLTRICFVDYDRDMVLVIARQNPETQEEEIVAVGRLSKIHGSNDAEYAMLVNDAFQRRGLGTEMLTRLLQIGRDEGVERVFAYMLGENRGMRLISKRLGFQFQREGSLFKAAVEL
jgi:acetyltransferase